MMKRFFLLLTLLTSWLWWTAPTTLAQNDSLPLVALCNDGRQIVGYALSLNRLSPNGTVRLTAVGLGDFDPAFGIANPDGTFDCTNNSTGAKGTAVAVPGLGRVEANDFAAQRTITIPNNGELNVVVGGFPGQSGQFGLVIENLRLDRVDEIDRMRIKIPPSATKEWVNVFMVGKATTLDPAMSLYVGDSVRSIRDCDNAGTRTCSGVPNLIERGAVINSADLYPGDAFDAGVMGAFGEENLVVEFKDITGTNTGEYVAVFAATAPGAVVDTSFVCENVIQEITDSSPAYNPSYDPAFLIDGDPATFWVTGAAPRDAQTGSRTATSVVVIKVDPDRQISKIRINGYAQSSEEFTANALRLFAVRFQNANDEVVTAIEAELLQQPGYQSFSFLPAQIDEIGLILVDNYGGTLFTVVDVQICALP